MFHSLPAPMVSKSLAKLVGACLILVLVAGGCTKGKDDKPADGGHHHHHDHPTVGPHGGAILEWGDHEFHIELVFDRAAQTASVYVLDHDMKKTEPTAVESAEIKLDGVGELIPLNSTPQDGETAEKSSRYVAKHAALGGKALFSGRVSGKVKGKPHAYFAQFKETAANPAAKVEHDHDHGGDHAHGEDHAHDKPADHAKTGKEHADHDHAHEKDAHKDGHENSDAPAKDAKPETHGDEEHEDHKHDDADHKHEDGKPTDEQILKRTEQLIYTSENLRKFTEDWERFWFMDSPDHVMPAERHGSGSMP